MQPRALSAEAAARDNTELHQMFADARVRPYVGARFPLTQTAVALRFVADRRALGKVVIDISESEPGRQR